MKKEKVCVRKLSGSNFSPGTTIHIELPFFRYLVTTLTITSLEICTQGYAFRAIGKLDAYENEENISASLLMDRQGKFFLEVDSR